MFTISLRWRSERSGTAPRWRKHAVCARRDVPTSTLAPDVSLRCGSTIPISPPAKIAHRLGVSLRLLQKVFAHRGETVMGQLWQERVSRAARLLSAPEAADRSITDIAFACGFNDSSHFGRVFAERMGMAPSRWRKQAG